MLGREETHEANHFFVPQYNWKTGLEASRKGWVPRRNEGMKGKQKHLVRSQRFGTEKKNRENHDSLFS